MSGLAEAAARVRHAEEVVARALNESQRAWDRYTGNGWPPEVLSGEVTYLGFVAKRVVQALAENP